ncbi:MAG: HigA family addiction module antitoxin [Halieaceae bacterium]|nr:HigA family addiction module antitoxin [Halieaceae bacterium]
MSENKQVVLNNPSHPGEVLREWIEGHDVTIVETAARLKISRAKLSRILSGRGSIPAALAVDLEAMGWSTARFWLALQAQFDIARLLREREAA